MSTWAHQIVKESLFFLEWVSGTKSPMEGGEDPCGGHGVSAQLLGAGAGRARRVATQCMEGGLSPEWMMGGCSLHVWTMGARD
jgi:hypothetical protein